MTKSTTWTRRSFLESLGGAALVGSVSTSATRLVYAQQDSNSHGGAVAGPPLAREVGLRVLADGGNAIDAAVATAFSAAVVAPYQCGLAGYGGHMKIALAGPKKITSIDFNTMAPAAARADMYPLQADGTVKDQVNDIGWLACGVPGTLAGLQLALDRYGSRPLAELLEPAIRFTAEGIVVPENLARAIRNSAVQLAKDPTSARLYLHDGMPLKAGERLKNPDAAEMLRTLAKRGTVDSFYHGDIAAQVAESYRKGGGLVTEKDLAAYRAREVKPLSLAWRGHKIYTAPLTAGGLTALEAISLRKALGEAADPSTTSGAHARLEALRIAWHDRLRLLGDPVFVDVPVAKLLSPDYANEWVDRIRAAVKQKQRLSLETAPREQNGTVHISTADRDGNLVALTLTHGAAFGAHVTLDGLGLMVGAGLARFDPRPDHPNAPAPGKRPLHNMCPTIVEREGRAVLALGGAGGRRIPSSIVSVLSHLLEQRAPLAEALSGGRVHTEGGDDVWYEGSVGESLDYFKQLGFETKRYKIALVSAAAFDPATGRTISAAK